MTTRAWLLAVGGVFLLAATYSLAAAPPDAGTDRSQVASVACPRCGWAPPATRVTQTARNVAELMTLVGHVVPGTTILLEDGEYRLPSTIDLLVPDVVLRSKSGDPTKVILRGAGMDERQVGVALSLSAPRLTIADVTVGYVGYHGIQVRGERLVSNVVLHNIRVVDTGQQLVKGSSGGGGFSENILVACSTFEYADHAPSNYTNGVDVLGGKGWHVRDNRFLRIRGPERDGWKAGPAILFWGGSQDTLVERNLILDSFRDIAFGLGPAAAPPEYTRPGMGRLDHARGAIRNNVIRNLNPWADEGIEANAAAAFGIDHNTVLVNGLPWAISVRFPESDGKVRNNLTSRAILLRDGGKAGMKANVETAGPDWFVNPGATDFHLSVRGRPAIDAAEALPDITDDFYRRPRKVGRGADAGAVEQGPN